MAVYKVKNQEKKTGSRVRIRIAALLLGLPGSLLLSGGVFASWSPIASITSGNLAAAALRVQVSDANSTTFATGLSNLLPGDYMNRYVDVQNTGSVAQAFTGNVVGSGTLAQVMTVQVDACSQAWASNGSCAGTTTPILAAAASTPNAGFSLSSLAPNGVTHVRMQFKLNALADQTTYQGTTATQTVTFTGPAVNGGSDRTTG